LQDRAEAEASEQKRFRDLADRCRLVDASPQLKAVSDQLEHRANLSLGEAAKLGHLAEMCRLAI